MKKIDSTVLKETAYIGAMVLIFSLALQSVFLIIGKWDYTVLLGNLLGFIAAVGNFFLMGLSVQASLNKEEKDAKNFMKFSQSLRLLLLFVIAVVGYLVPVFNILAVLIPFLFPRIAVALRPLFMKNR
ncbi:MAG: ATP synthase subunit I [Acutalibacteraceae bacterium]